MTDILYPDWSNKDARSYTKTTIGNEVVSEGPFDFAAIDAEIAADLGIGLGFLSCYGLATPNDKEPA